MRRLDVPHAQEVLGKSTAAPTWWTANRDGTEVVVMRCPNGHRGDLAEHHVNPDGAVVPSVVCPVEGCGFHEQVRLVGWPRGRCSCSPTGSCY